jgi:hypothetical protein
MVLRVVRFVPVRLEYVFWSRSEKKIVFAEVGKDEVDQADLAS